MDNHAFEEIFTTLPPLYATAHKRPEDKIAGAHFISRDTHWYAVEYDAADRLFYGCVLTTVPNRAARWTYFYLDALLADSNVLPDELRLDRTWAPTLVGTLLSDWYNKKQGQSCTG